MSAIKQRLRLMTPLMLALAAAASANAKPQDPDLYFGRQNREDGFQDLAFQHRQSFGDEDDDVLGAKAGSGPPVFNSSSSFIRLRPDMPYKHRHFSATELSRLFRSAGCNQNEIALVCKDINDTIVIENASFYSLPPSVLNCSRGPIGPLSQSPSWAWGASSSSMGDPLRDAYFPQLLGLPRASRDLRQALNRRCSGLGGGQECSFNLGLDHPESAAWGDGLVDIFFRCAPRAATHRFCDREARIKLRTNGNSEFLMSPVYPKYYVGGRRCVWSLRAEPGQRIQLRFLDISLRERQSSTDPECADAVSVSERGKTLLRMCGESTEDIVLLSDGNTLEVSMETRTKSIFPRRGLLAEFWALGCATQRDPGEGYLQFRNDTHAVYSCSIGHLFLPSLDRTKVLRCISREWNGEVGQCYSYEFLRKYGNSSVLELLAAKLGNISLAPSSSSSSHPSSSSSDPQQRVIVTSSSSWFSDVVLPVIVSGIVVIIALFAVIVLLLLRRHLQLERESLAAADEDRSALTPGSVRRHSPLMQLDITQHLARLHHEQQQQQAAMEGEMAAMKASSSAHVLRPMRDELFLC